MKTNIPFSEQRLKHQRTVDGKYRRDLILLIIALAGSIGAIRLLTVFAGERLVKVDNMPPEVVVLLIVSIACFLFFFKYARK